MNTCPNCGGTLSRKESAYGSYWGCDKCGGYAVGMAVLRKAVRHDCIVQAWSEAQDGGAVGRPCPMCDHLMSEVPVTLSDGTLSVDVCKTCQFFWFDPHELEAMPKAPAALVKPASQLSQEAREALAIAEVKFMAERAHAEDSSPDEAWKTIPAIFGLPVEDCTTPFKRIPCVTWTLAVLIALVTFSTLPHLRSAIAGFGLIPAEALRKEGLTLLTSFFLHGGIFHLLSNLYFMVMFGSHVEDYLGRRRFLILLLLATISGDALHVIAQPHSTVPCVGASGGISGLIAFYALKFPRNELDFLSRFGWVRMPAWGVFLLWVAMQAFGAFEQLSGFSDVAALAHIGGAAVGFLFWLEYRRLDADPAAATSQFAPLPK